MWRGRPRRVGIIAVGVLLCGCRYLPSELNRRASPPAELKRVAYAEALIESGDAIGALDWLRSDGHESGERSFRVRRAEQDALLALGRGDEALAEAEEGAAHGSVDDRVLLARLLDDRSARVELLEVLRVDPEHPFALYGCAILSVREGDVEQARDWVTRALRVDPTFPEALRLRAELRDRLSDYEGAASDYRDYLERSPTDRDAMYNLAVILHDELDEPGEAESLYSRILARDPDDPQATIGLAKRRTQQGEYAEAEQLYLRVGDRDPIAWFNLGLLYSDRMGRLVEARDCFERFREHEGASEYGADRVLYAPLLIEELDRRIESANLERP